MSFHVPNKYRIEDGRMGSTEALGNAGAFSIPSKIDGAQLKIIATDGVEIHPVWEHVSVSRAKRCPNWLEMCQIKSLFWDPVDCVLQFHPPEKDYVNHMPYCLHLWRSVNEQIPMPPLIFV